MSRAEYQAAYQAKHRSRLLPYWRAYHRRNRAKAKAREAANRAHRNALKRARRERDPEAARLKERNYRQTHIVRVRQTEVVSQTKRREKKRAEDRQYKLTHKAAFRASVAQSKAAKPDLYAHHNRMRSIRRRHRVKNLQVESMSIGALAERDHDICHLCDKVVAADQRSFDHLIPVVRHGPFVGWNLALAHVSCNRTRGSKQVLRVETPDGAREYMCKRVAVA